MAEREQPRAKRVWYNHLPLSRGCHADHESVSSLGELTPGELALYPWVIFLCHEQLSEHDCFDVSGAILEEEFSSCRPDWPDQPHNAPATMPPNTSRPPAADTTSRHVTPPGPQPPAAPHRRFRNGRPAPAYAHRAGSMERQPRAIGAR